MINKTNMIKDIILDLAQKQTKDYSSRNQILYVAKENPKIGLSECAELCNQMFRSSITKDEVYSLYSRSFRTQYGLRPSVFYNRARKLGDLLHSAVFLSTDVDAAEKMYLDTKHIKRAVIIRIALYDFYEITENLQSDDVLNALLKLDATFARECFESILGLAKGLITDDISEYERKILQLEADNTRANNLIARLQDEYDEQMRVVKSETQESLMQELNSASYGYLLDSAANLNSSVRKLRRIPNAIPQELLGISSLVRNILQFAEDCGVTPMADLGETFEISGQDAEYYDYKGLPFTSATDTKKVVVISSGWEIKEKNVIISPTVVKEVIAEELKTTEKTEKSEDEVIIPEMQESSGTVLIESLNDESDACRDHNINDNCEGNSSEQICEESSVLTDSVEDVLENDTEGSGIITAEECETQCSEDLSPSIEKDDMAHENGECNAHVSKDMPNTHETDVDISNDLTELKDEFPLSGESTEGSVSAHVEHKRTADLEKELQKQKKREKYNKTMANRALKTSSGSKKGKSKKS